VQELRPCVSFGRPAAAGRRDPKVVRWTPTCAAGLASSSPARRAGGGGRGNFLLVTRLVRAGQSLGVGEGVRF
jgi:hypothetical protein